eukprot:3203773-Amphidinium_carterae.1
MPESLVCITFGHKGIASINYATSRGDTTANPDLNLITNKPLEEDLPRSQLSPGLASEIGEMHCHYVPLLHIRTQFTIGIWNCQRIESRHIKIIQKLSPLAYHQK